MFRPLTSIAVAIASAAVLAGCNDAPLPSATPSAPPPAISPPVTSAPVIPTPPPIATTAVDAAATAKDSAATDPKGTLSKEEESKSMPMAAHGNNHSSPSLEPAPKK